MSSISRYTETRDHFELWHDSEDSGFGNPIHELNRHLKEHWRHLGGQPTHVRLPMTSR